ncbi:MAG: 16S rRNA processing protein RimM [Rhodobacteraceae bacterium]|jgi:16S rRNA processing protein RimM|nr:16S rRNA processing protein RimM [Paracoccaceae bacterium]
MTGTDRICVGAIAGAFGVQGEVRLKSYCAEPSDIAAYGPLYASDGRRFTLRLTRPVAGGLGARVSGVATREEAEALKGTELYVDRSRLPALPDDEFYHADLVGLSARDPGGAEIGRVISVQNHGAGDLLEIAVPDRAGSLLVPFTRAAVPTVDLGRRLVIVDLPEGLD